MDLTNKVMKKLHNSYHITKIDTLEELTIIAKDFINLKRVNAQIEWVTIVTFPHAGIIPREDKKTSLVRLLSTLTRS